jgi:hypothetical protein
MTMAQTGEVLSPVADVPVFGDLVELLDGAAVQAGLPLWLRAFAELVLVGVLAYLVLRLMTTRLLPWAGNALVLPAMMVTKGLLVLLLLPDLGVARTARRFGRTPPEFVYGYGAAVVAVVEAVEELVRRGMPKLGLARFARPWLLVALLVVAFLVWNDQNCAAGSPPGCTSPVQVWLASFDVVSDSG